MPRVDAPTQYTLQLRQGALGLEEPQAYLSESDVMREVRQWYRGRIQFRLGTLHWDEDPQGTADAVMQVETELARHSVRQYLLSPDPAHSSLTIAELEQLTGLPWRPYLQALGLPTQESVELVPTDYFRALGGQLRELDVQTLRSYLRWQVLGYATALWGGFTILAPPWETCASTSELAFGSWLWQTDAAGHAGNETLARVKAIWQAIQEAFVERVVRGEAMGSAAPLSRKLRDVQPLIGYPLQLDWNAAIAVSPIHFFQNVLSAHKAWFDHQYELVGQPVGASDAVGPPSISLPAYAVRLNRVVLPWSILQPPIFSREFPSVLNFGHLGTILGHELAHAIDRYGRRFDSDGRLTTNDSDPSGVVSKQEECLGRHFSRFEAAPRVYFSPSASVLPALQVDPDLTLDEDFADVLGVQLAFAAYRRQRPESAPENLAPGLTDDQTFFVAFAQNWCGEPEKRVRQFLTEFDVHATPRARINGSLSAVPEFGESFQCPRGSPMRPDERCEFF